jgi:hypothetical protein
LHIISVAVFDETDNSIFFNGIVLDITKEMETTAALKAREKELKGENRKPVRSQHGPGGAPAKT